MIVRRLIAESRPSLILLAVAAIFLVALAVSSPVNAGLKEEGKAVEKEEKQRHERHKKAQEDLETKSGQVKELDKLVEELKEKIKRRDKRIANMDLKGQFGNNKQEFHKKRNSRLEKKREAKQKLATAERELATAHQALRDSAEAAAAANDEYRSYFEDLSSPGPEHRPVADHKLIERAGQAEKAWKNAKSDKIRKKLRRLQAERRHLKNEQVANRENISAANRIAELNNEISELLNTHRQLRAHYEGMSNPGSGQAQFSSAPPTRPPPLVPRHSAVAQHVGERGFANRHHQYGPAPQQEESNYDVVQGFQQDQDLYADPQDWNIGGQQVDYEASGPLDENAETQSVYANLPLEAAFGDGIGTVIYDQAVVVPSTTTAQTPPNPQNAATNTQLPPPFIPQTVQNDAATAVLNTVLNLPPPPAPINQQQSNNLPPSGNQPPATQ